MPARVTSSGKSLLHALGILVFSSWVISAHATVFSVINTNDSGAGSLRQAILDANNNVGSNYIAFAISTAGLTIKPTSALPALSNAMTIDGTTQTGYVGVPRVEINGTNAGSSNVGLYVLSSNCIIRGLCINRFGTDGIRLEGTGSNVVQANFVGTDLTGTNSAPNGWGLAGYNGITLVSPGNLIGGPDPTNRNLVSGNAFCGVTLLNSSAALNTIQGNYIGCDITGTKRLPNASHGILLNNASSNLIGGTVTGARNLVSGNAQGGVFLNETCLGNLVQGNFIGTTLTGTGALSNAQDGINLTASLNGPKYNLLGGTNTAARNLISGNGGRGVLITGGSARYNQVAGNYIGTSSNGLAKIPNANPGVDLFNASSNLVGGPTVNAGNLISGNTLSGVKIGNLGVILGNVVQNNLIGTDATGTNALGNGQYGIIVLSNSANTIGPGNVVAANVSSGILIGDNANNNLVIGNLVGTDITGTRSLSNGQNGLRLESKNTTVGGTTAAARNLISGNFAYGIYLYSVAASNNNILGNYIGTDATGTAGVPNGYSGIGLDGGNRNTIGTTAGRNIISANGYQAIYIAGSNTTANVIKGNYLGTDVSGMNGLPNGTTLLTLTNASGQPTNVIAGGIDISGAAATVIGGPNPGEGNLIAANWRGAIIIGETGGSNTVIQGNWVGVKADGFSALGNEWHGVELRDTGGGVGTIIGGSTPGAGNILANAQRTQRSGVRVRSLVSGTIPNTNVLIRGNSIYHNGGSSYTGLGIAIGDKSSGSYSATTNDACDSDTGANLLQNYPVLSAAYTDGSRLYVTGTLNSTSGQSFLIQVFTNAPDVISSSGFYQGQTFVAETNITTASCSGSFIVSFPCPALAGQRITATATDSNNNTSEFSTPVVVQATPVLTATVFTNTATQLTLAWPTNISGLALQQTTNLLPTIVWNSVTNVPGISGTNYSVSLVRTNGQRYFRLVLP